MPEEGPEERCPEPHLGTEAEQQPQGGGHPGNVVRVCKKEVYAPL